MHRPSARDVDRRPGLLSSISLQLTAALLAIAVLSVVTIVTAVVTLERVRQSHNTITGSDLPELGATATLGVTANAIASAAHALTSADTPYVLLSAMNRITDRLSTLDQVLLGVSERSASEGLADPTLIERVTDRRNELADNIIQIEETVLLRIEVEEAFDDRLEEVSDAFLAFNEVLHDETRSDGSLKDIRLLFGELTVHLVALPGLENPSRVRALERDALDNFDWLLAVGAGVTLDDGTLEFETELQSWHDLMFDEGGLFALHRDYLELRKNQDGLLTHNKFVSSQFVSAVADLDFHVRNIVQRRNLEVSTEVDNRTILLLAVSAVLGALLVLMIIVVRRRVLARLTELTHAMTDHAAGRPATIPTAGRDELARMGQALQYFVTTLSDRERANEEARLAAEEANRAKSVFLATVSHEIRTPMNSVLGMAEVLEHSGLSDDASESTRTIRESANALLAIIDDILDFSKIEAGELEIDRAPTSVRHIVESVVDLVGATVSRKGIELASFIDPDVPQTVLADPVRLRQIVLNLVGNALKFTERGSVCVRVGAAPVGGDHLTLRIDVADTGIGIAAERLKDLFEPFKQAEASTTRRYGGTGLGLSICERLVSRMGGEIGVESESGAGSTFWFAIPVEEVVGADADPMTVPDLSGARALVVGDGTLFAQEAMAMLADAGIEAEGLGDVAAAAARLASGPGAIDLAVIDARVAGARDLVARLGCADPGPLADDAVFVAGLQGSTADNGGRVVHRPLRRSRLLRAAAVALGRVEPDEFPAADVTARIRDLAHRDPSVEAALAAGQLILVAEDQENNRDVVRRQLGILGYACEMAEDGLVARDMFDPARHSLVLTDCHMPNLDGFGLTAAIRAGEKESARRTPVVALTANALVGETERCLAAGMDDFLSKPATLHMLGETLARWIGPPAAAPRGDPAADVAAPDDPVANDPVAVERAPVPEAPAMPFDLDVFEEMFGEVDLDLLAGLVAEFQPNLEELLDTMDEAIARHDLTTLAQASHKAAGAAGSVTAAGLDAALRVLLAAARNGESPAAIAGAMAGVREEAARVLAWRPGDPVDGPAAEAVS